MKTTYKASEFIALYKLIVEAVDNIQARKDAAELEISAHKLALAERPWIKRFFYNEFADTKMRKLLAENVLRDARRDMMLELMRLVQMAIDSDADSVTLVGDECKMLELYTG